MDVAVGYFVPVFTNACDETLVRFHGWNERPFSYNDFEAVSCESEPMSSEPYEVRTLGVVTASEHQQIFVALASLICAQRYDMALKILDNELGGGC